MSVTMTKRELVIRVANQLGMTQNDVARIIEGTFETISHSLSEGSRWELRDFGVFEVKTRVSRMGRNPRTGDQVPVPERRVVTFRPGKKMRERISGAGVSLDATVPVSSPPSAALLGESEIAEESAENDADVGTKLPAQGNAGGGNSGK